MFTNPSQRFFACFVTTVASLGLVVACGSDDKKKGSSGGDKTQTPVATTPTAPNPTTVGTGGFPTNPGYPYPGNPGTNYPPYNPGNGNVTVNVQELEQRLQGNWISMQQGLSLQVSNFQNRAVTMTTMNQGGRPDLPRPQDRQGTYDVDTSRTDSNRLGLVLRFFQNSYSAGIYFCQAIFAQAPGFGTQNPGYGQDQITCTEQGRNQPLDFIRDVYGSGVSNQPSVPNPGWPYNSGQQPGVQPFGF